MPLFSRAHKKLGKKDKKGRLKSNPLAACYAPALLGNPSHFAVFASVRRSILSRWRHLHLLSAEQSDDSDIDDDEDYIPLSKLPKVCICFNFIMLILTLLSYIFKYVLSCFRLLVLDCAQYFH